jgi:uncharacterized protein
MVDSTMPNAEPKSDPITLAISEIVLPTRIDEYEAWTKGINQSAQQFEGFVGVEIIRPRDREYLEYVVIVKFDNYANYKNWITSPVYQKWMAQSREFVSGRSHQQLPTGLELWFTLPRNRLHNPPQPAYYKQVILGVVTVYPLILLSNLLLDPFLKGVPSLLSLLISVTFVSALLSYPVMPYLTKALSFWLYPSSRR